MNHNFLKEEAGKMTYEEARAFIDDTARYGYVLGLDTVRELLSRLGNPQDDLKFVHIAGTNGKGSVLAYVSTALKEAGYRVGRYISPVIFDYRERIQVNEEYITREGVARLAERIRDAGQQMLRDGFHHPTTFEAETAMAFLWFQEMKCDIVVLECGMGGLTDATNVIRTTLVSVLSEIGMDHMGFLGNTLEEIAEVKAGIIKPDTLVVSAAQRQEAEEVIKRVCREKGAQLRMVKREEEIAEVKAGIIKPDTLVVSAAQRQEAEEVIKRVCREKGAQLRMVKRDAITDVRCGFEDQSFSYKGYRELKPGLLGSWQIENAALAVEALLALREKGFAVSEEAIRKGLASAVWPGRFTKIGEEPLFIADGAHNRDAADRLLETLQLYFPDRRKIFIMGVLADKDYEYVARQLTPLAAKIVTVETPGNPRALPAKELAECVRRYNSQAEAAESIEDAVRRAYTLAEKEDMILAFGSLSYLGELMRTVRKLEGERK